MAEKQIATRVTSEKAREIKVRAAMEDRPMADWLREAIDEKLARERRDGGRVVPIESTHQEDSTTDHSESDSDGTRITCKNCDYEWTYKGTLQNATCPRCSGKTPTGLTPNGSA